MGGSVPVPTTSPTTVPTTTPPAATTTTVTTTPPAATTTVPAPGGTGASGEPGEPTGADDGYWVASSKGGVTAYGDDSSYGTAFGTSLAGQVRGMAATPDYRGYWLVGSKGGVLAFGDATWYGSASKLHLHRPVVGMASTPDGGGYWLVFSDGGVFAYGDAGYYELPGIFTYVRRSSASLLVPMDGLLAGLSRRWRLCLRGRRFLWVHGHDAPSQADSGDSAQRRRDAVISWWPKTVVFSLSVTPVSPVHCPMSA